MFVVDADHCDVIKRQRQQHCENTEHGRPGKAIRNLVRNFTLVGNFPRGAILQVESQRFDPEEKEKTKITASDFMGASIELAVARRLLRIGKRLQLFSLAAVTAGEGNSGFAWRFFL